MNSLTFVTPTDIPPLPWNETKPRSVLDLLDRSGLSVAAFARENGIKLPLLYAWRQCLKLLRASNPPTAKAPEFMHVQVVGGEPVSPKSKSRIEVVHPSGFVIRLEGLVNIVQLIAMLHAVEQLRC